MKNGVIVSIVRMHGHSFLIWGLTLVNYLTDIKLR